MKVVNFLTVLFITLASVNAFAKEIKDTLYTSDRDRLIISYDVRRTNNQFTVQFNSVQKKLGRRNGERYRKLSEVVVLFFDRTGSYRDMIFSNMVPEAFMIPSNVNYVKSGNGYFFLQDNPVLSFDIGTNDDVVLSIPIYWAHYERKRRYKLFGNCKYLEIKVGNGSSSQQDSDGKFVKQTIMSSMEIEDDNGETAEALSCINTITTLLATQENLPFSDGLQYEITRLRLMKDKVGNAEVEDKISETLTLCEAKKSELESRIADEERQVKMAEERAQAQQDSIQSSLADAERLQAKEEKKRNFWMIVGGVILVVLCFVGNQIFQHVRSIKNQKNMMEMQQSITRQAEDEVKRRAQSVARDKTNQVVNTTMPKSKGGIQKKLPRVGRTDKPKNISI